MADKPPPAAMPPPSEPFPGSRTPGWNDPPPVQFNPLGSGASGGKPKRINLNKRVAFPLQGTTGAAAPSSAPPKPTAVVPPNQNGDLPPPPPMMPPSAAATAPPLPAMPPSVGCSQPVARVRPTHQANPEPEPQPNAEPAIPLGDPFQSLRTHFDRAEADAENPTAKTERERAVVGQLWETGILGDDTQAILVEIAHAMQTKDFNTARQLYAYLQANHGEEVSIFNSAMKHLVESPPTTESSLLLVTTIEEPMDIGGGDNPNT